MSLLIRGAQVGFNGPVCDVRITSRLVNEVGTHLVATSADTILPAHDLTLLPGIHDHHIHLLALTAQRSSVDCNDRDTATLADLGSHLRSAPVGADGCVRAVGFDDVKFGLLSRHDLDLVTHEVPVRIQHQSGALWLLNTAALRALRIIAPGSANHSPCVTHDGLELDSQGTPTGRIWRADDWLATLALEASQRRQSQTNTSAPHGPTPFERSLADVGRELASYGVTGVTDASPHLTAESLRSLEHAIHRGEIPQDVQVLTADMHTSITSGPRKIVLADHEVPSVEYVIDQIRIARSQSRAVAMHCVTPDTLAVALAALHETGSVPGDRIEHASVVPEAMLTDLASLRLSVVTQPGFIADRGDRLGDDFGIEWAESLYRVSSLLAHGIQVGFSSDAPYGPLSPWSAMYSAVTRRTPGGSVLAPHERVSTRTALEGFLGPLHAPGGAARGIGIGVQANLILVDRDALTSFDHDPGNPVHHTIINGALVYSRA